MRNAARGITGAGCRWTIGGMMHLVALSAVVAAMVHFQGWWATLCPMLVAGYLILMAVTPGHLGDHRVRHSTPILALSPLALWLVRRLLHAVNLP